MRDWVWLVAGMGLVGCSSSKLVYEDVNNYTYSGTLTVQDWTVPPQQDVTVAWSTLTTDIRGREVTDPASIEQVTLVHFPEPFDTVRPKIERNEIGQSDAQDIYLFENPVPPGVTTTPLSAFEITGINIDLTLLQEDPNSTWFLSLVNLPDGRTDILSSVRLVLDSTATDTVANFTNDSASLDVEVDLHSAPALVAPAEKRLTFDWQAASVDVFGHDFDDQLGDELIIGHYNTDDVAEVEADFLQLDTPGVVSELYRLNVFSQRQADLSQARDDNGNAFPGFNKDGTWLIGVICSTCTTPIPQILSVVEVN